MSSPWEVVASRVAFEGYSTVRVDDVVMPDGSTGQREIVEHRPAVAVVPVTADGDVILLRQYRHAFGTSLLEIPAGGVDDGETDPEAAAQRELCEEIGQRARRLVPLTTFLNSVGWCTEYTHLWLGTDLVEATADGFEPSAEEAAMEVVVLPLEEAVAAVHEGTITDSKTVIGLLLAAHHLAAGG